MSGGTGGDCERRGGAVIRAVCVLVALVFVALGACVAAGCTSEADLVQILVTEQDATVRQEAAADLAGRHSLEATQQLVTAAATNETASAGLDLMADEYGVVLESAVQRAAEAKKEELDEKTTLRLEETVDCLASSGTSRAVKVLGTFACLDTQGISGVKELQVRGIEALGELASDEAIAELIDVGLKTSEKSDARQITLAAGKALEGIGEPAVEPLMALAEDNEWAYEVLVDVGEDATPALLEVLASQKWVESALADIGAPAIPLVVERLESTDAVLGHRALGILLRMYEDAVYEADAVLLTADMVPRIIADVSDEAFAAENLLARSDGFDHVAMAELVLIDTGEPAVASILAWDYEWKWFLLGEMGADAVPALTSAMTGDVRDDALSAAATLATIHDTSPEAVASLMAPLETEDLEAVATNYLLYIALGQEGSDELIAAALLKYGTKQMGLDCLNCGNDVLDAAARKWGSKHGYYVKEGKTESGVGFLPWGLGGPA